MKILIAEHDLLSRMSLQDILARKGVIHTANNGQEVLDAYNIALLGQREPYDIIFLDTRTLVIDCQEVIDLIRDIEKERGIGGRDMVHFILTTFSEDKKTVLDLFVKGTCQAFLEKPFTPAGVAQFLAKYETVYG